MKAHRFKTKITTREEVENEFYSEVGKRVNSLTAEKTKGEGVIVASHYSATEDGIKSIAALKLDIMKEWEKKGRNLAFLKNNPNYNFQYLLSLKHYGKDTPPL